MTVKTPVGVFHVVEAVPNNSKKSLIVITAYREKRQIHHRKQYSKEPSFKRPRRTSAEYVI
ncbi:MAG: hypothetical protein K5669_11055 [Lachnospiraceae bacterium]|nr:hypothetical protein [Lachnospiraceae bacterium]